MHGVPELITSQLATRLGRTLADLAAMPHAHLDDQFQAPPAAIGFRQIGGAPSDEPTGDDFFRGVVLYPGSEARRELLAGWHNQIAIAAPKFSVSYFC